MRQDTAHYAAVASSWSCGWLQNAATLSVAGGISAESDLCIHVAPIPRRRMVTLPPIAVNAQQHATAQRSGTGALVPRNEAALREEVGVASRTGLWAAHARRCQPLLPAGCPSPGWGELSWLPSLAGSRLTPTPRLACLNVSTIGVRCCQRTVRVSWRRRPSRHRNR